MIQEKLRQQAQVLAVDLEAEGESDTPVCHGAASLKENPFHF